MVSVRTGVRGITESSSKTLHSVESHLITAYNWLSGAAMSDSHRRRQKLAEFEPVRQTNSICL